MKFKTETEEAEFQKVSLILQLIVRDIELLVRGFAKEITITRVLSPVSGESGVHLDHRAVDIRDEFQGERTFSAAEIAVLLDSINNKWKRNDGYETIIHHSFHGGPWHLHVQIPELTRAYEK